MRVIAEKRDTEKERRRATEFTKFIQKTVCGVCVCVLVSKQNKTKWDYVNLCFIVFCDSDKPSSCFYAWHICNRIGHTQTHKQK